MPTYHCTSPAGLLNDAARQRVATAITDTHEALTGAQGFFAQVLFHELASGRSFVGGVPSAEPPLFVHGQIRAGRSPETRERLVCALVDTLGVAAGLPQERIWVYVSELPPGQMAEYGVSLPQPGDEAAWLEGLPADLRRRLTADY